MAEIRTKHLAIQAHLFESMTSDKAIIALLEINADQERVSIYGFDAYDEGKGEGVEMGSLIVNTSAFKSIVVGWLAWHLGIEASRIHELPKILDEFARYRAAYEALDKAFSDVPGYMGDESYGDKLSLTLVAARDLAKWKNISLAEFQDELGIESDGGE